jgi:Family of unknown function (DUF5681)
MSRRKMPPTNEYEVGYGKPPVRSRFRKGQSGNPGGRPRGITAGRARALILEEAYRPVRLREGDNVIELPALQAILRAQVARAAQGNGPAQRAVIEAVQAIEREIAAQAAVSESGQAKITEMSRMEAARRIAYALRTAKRKLDQDSDLDVLLEQVGGEAVS